LKILLTGKNGQVGFELQRALAPLGEVVAPDREACDLGDAGALRELVRRIAPDVIVNPAAYTAVDKAESDQEAAFAINARAPGVLGEEAARLGALVVQFSTDYVFDGSKDGAYSEADTPAPQSVYGRSKYEGEKALAEANARHLILRTSWVVGAHGGNFAKTMLRLAKERDKLTVINDQIGAPTGADLLADITAHALRAAQQQPVLSGTYHAVASGETSWHGYAKHVVEFARNAGQPIKVAADAIEPVPTSAFPTPAKRPGNSRMNTRKLQETFGFTLPPWQTGVERMLTEVLV
jgi:dTDP-4-dehydrorhamnose reductase